MFSILDESYSKTRRGGDTVYDFRLVVFFFWSRVVISSSIHFFSKKIIENTCTIKFSFLKKKKIKTGRNFIYVYYLLFFRFGGSQGIHFKQLIFLKIGSLINKPFD